MTWMIVLLHLLVAGSGKAAGSGEILVTRRQWLDPSDA